MKQTPFSPENLLNLGNFAELKRRIFYFFLGLAIYRLAVHIPVPGINLEAYVSLFQKAAGTIFGFLDIFSGGALRRFSVCALGVMPYISASIILELMTVVYPEIKELYREGPEGKRKLAYYTRYLTLAICLIQGLGIALGLERMTAPDGTPIVLNPGWGFRLETMLSLTAGSMFLVWLGEQMTEHAIGNGISVIIFAGIVAGLFPAIARTLKFVSTGEYSVITLLFLLIFVFTILLFVCFMELAHRRVPIQYAKRQVGLQVVGGQSTYLPIKVNTAGVIPPIFASAILMFPNTIAQFFPFKWAQVFVKYFSFGSFLYEFVYAVLIIFFCYFYTGIIFNPKDVADNLKKWGAFIPGIRPGRATEEFLRKVLNRITFIGAIYVAFVCVLPGILIKKFGLPFYFGGTSLLIVVGVAMELMAQMETLLLSKQYEQFIRKSRLKVR